MYYSVLTYIDWEYWQKAPVALNIFIIVQYTILALTIRLPITSSVGSSSATKMTIILILLLLINTIIGIIWLRELTQPNLNERGEVIPLPRGAFDLKDEYIAHGVVLILVPLSVFIFLLIVLVKFLCFFLAGQK